MRRLSVFAAAGAGLFVGAIVFVPRAANANALSRIQNAFDNVKEFRIVSYLVDDSGKLTISSVMDSVGGNTRLQRGSEIDYEGGGQYTIYRPDEKLAITRKLVRKGRPIDDVQGMLTELRKSTWVKNIQVDENDVYNGKPAIKLSFESTNEPSRIRMYADRDTSLPFRGEVDWRTPSGGWRLDRVCEVSYDSGLDASRVAPAFAAGTRVIDNDQLKTEWQNRLDRGVATIDKGGAHVVIRDVVGLATGDVMVLYTNGRKHLSRKDFGAPHKASEIPPMPNLDAMNDSSGNSYISVDGVQGTVYTTDDQFVGGYVFNGEDLQAAWYTPLEQRAPPRDVKLHFMDMDVSFDTTVEVRPAGDTPEWAELIGMAPGDAMEVRANAAEARGTYYLGRDDDKAAKELETSIRLNDMRMAAIGERILQGSAYALLGSALHRVGRDKEARSALERAIRDDPSGKANYQLILNQLAK